MENLGKLKAQLTKNKVPCWVLYCEEHNDFVFKRFVSAGATAGAWAVVTPEAGFLIVHELDFDNVKGLNGWKVLSYKGKEDLGGRLKFVFEKIGHPAVVALNYSKIGMAKTDIVGFGLYKRLTKRIASIYREVGKNVRFDSAEFLIIGLFDSKGEKTIERMKIAAGIANEILISAFSEIREGQTEIQIAGIVHSLAEGRTVEGAKIDFAWDKAGCPIVLVGDNLTKGGHANPSSTQIKKGDTVYFDFGVTLTFDDGERVASDIQRMGYFLRDGETSAPPAVQKVFDTLVQAIDKGMEVLKSGVLGYKVDEAVRGVITGAGYPNYNHGTGHAIGEDAHGIGVALSVKAGALAKLPIAENGTYTIEPRIATPNGGSLEEMVCVRAGGAEFISARQTELMLIRG